MLLLVVAVVQGRREHGQLFNVFPVDDDRVAVKVHALVERGVGVGVEEVGGALGGACLTRRVADAPVSWLTNRLLTSDQQRFGSRGGWWGLQGRFPPRLTALL